MFFSLPHELKSIVLDFLGDVTIDNHRRARFVRAELAAFRVLARSWRNGHLCPSFIRNLQGFKEALELAYANAQREPLVKVAGLFHRIRSIP